MTKFNKNILESEPPIRFIVNGFQWWYYAGSTKQPWRVIPVGVDPNTKTDFRTATHEEAKAAYAQLKADLHKDAGYHKTGSTPEPEAIDVEINDFDEKKHEQRDNQPEEWSTPQPITTSLLPVLPLLPEMLPEGLRPWLVDIASRMRCALDYVAATAIVMLSSLIGTRLTIQPKTKDDWTIVPNLWGAIIGDPSSMKTPSSSEVLKMLNRLVLSAQKKYDEESQVYEKEMVDYEATKKAYSAQAQDRIKGKSISHPVTYPDTPIKPSERRYMANDPTTEKLAELHNENPTGLLVTRDEIIGLLATWGKAGREQDRAFYLEGWNGYGSITIDRIARGTIHVKNVCISLFGGIQPSRLLGYLRAATQYENDGFVQRLQVAVYPDRAHWDYVDEFPDKSARDNAFDLIRRISDSDFSIIAFPADEYNRFPFTRFTPSAQQLFKEWLTEWETKTLPGEDGLLLEHFTKYRSLMPSLALIFHTINSEATPVAESGNQKRLVSYEATKMAIQWCEYLQSHARRIYGLLDSASVVAARALLQHLKAGDLKNGFKVREVRQKGWAGLNTSEEVDSALTELIACGWVKEVIPPAPVTGRPEAPHYLIHPQLISQSE
ncbi:YfjI family protein [Spirosoma gilvum]